MKIDLPPDVYSYINKIFSDCNNFLSFEISKFPAIYEDNLDQQLVSQLCRSQAPVKLASDWIVRIDTHYIGGGRHYGTWEVADIGLMIIFRRNGTVVRSKLAMLQSKKLYAQSIQKPKDPYARGGLGRLLNTKEEHQEIIQPRILKFLPSSRYLAFKKDDQQQETMSHFQDRFDIKMYYLFYNPFTIPHQVEMPLTAEPILDRNLVGCRVIPKDDLDIAIKSKNSGTSPSFAELNYLLAGDFMEEEHAGGWRLEHFVANLMLGCKEGMIDDSPNLRTMMELMNSKRRAMSASIGITIDLPEKR